MSVHFEKRSAKTEQTIPMASLPDVIFILLIFFMVTTVLRETNVKVRTLLPDAEALTKISQKRLVSNLYIGPRKIPGEAGQFGETAVQVDDTLIEDLTTIRRIMYEKVQEEPRLIVSLKVDRQAEMGVVYQVQEELREANALRISYSSTQETDV